MTEAGESKSSWFSTGIGRMVRGIIKLSIAGFLISLINNIPVNDTTLTIGNTTTTLPVGTIAKLIIAFVPIFLIVSGLDDMGIKL